MTTHYSYAWAAATFVRFSEKYARATELTRQFLNLTWSSCVRTLMTDPLGWSRLRTCVHVVQEVLEASPDKDYVPSSLYKPLLHRLNDLYTNRSQGLLTDPGAPLTLDSDGFSGGARPASPGGRPSLPKLKLGGSFHAPETRAGFDASEKRSSETASAVNASSRSSKEGL
jgi:hypothetical protein